MVEGEAEEPLVVVDIGGSSCEMGVFGVVVAVVDFVIFVGHFGSCLLS